MEKRIWLAGLKKGNEHDEDTISVRCCSLESLDLSFVRTSYNTSFRRRPSDCVSNTAKFLPPAAEGLEGHLCSSAQNETELDTGSCISSQSVTTWEKEKCFQLRGNEHVQDSVVASKQGVVTWKLYCVVLRSQLSPVE